jgi:hypothetical protein
MTDSSGPDRSGPESSEPESSGPELSEASRRALEALRKFSQDKKNTPAAERIPVARPERFDFLIGFDDEGRKFPVSEPETDQQK